MQRDGRAPSRANSFVSSTLTKDGGRPLVWRSRFTRYPSLKNASRHSKLIDDRTTSGRVRRNGTQCNQSGSCRVSRRPIIGTFVSQSLPPVPVPDGGATFPGCQPTSGCSSHQLWSPSWRTTPQAVIGSRRNGSEGHESTCLFVRLNHHHQDPRPGTHPGRIATRRRRGARS